MPYIRQARSLSELLAVPNRPSPPKDVPLSRRAFQRSDAAAELGLGTGAAVSLQLLRLREALEKDKLLRCLLEEIESNLLSLKG